MLPSSFAFPFTVADFSLPDRYSATSFLSERISILLADYHLWLIFSMIQNFFGIKILFFSRTQQNSKKSIFYFSKKSPACQMKLSLYKSWPASRSSNYKIKKSGPPDKSLN